MPLGFIRALRLLHDTFRHHPAGQRAHILGRFLTAPFLQTLDVIPEGARVLDIGAGHGAYARLAAEERAGQVVALEPDLRKTLIAFRHPRVKFVAGYDDCIRGLFDAVVVYDVFYRVPPTARDAFFQRIYDRLKPGGVLVLKDHDPSNRLKETWNRIQETITDKFLGLTIGEALPHDTAQQTGERMARAGFRDFQSRRIDFGYPHAHILYTARK